MYGKHSELEELVLLDELRFPLPRSGDLEIPAGIMHFNQAIWRVYRCKVVMGDEGSSARAMTPPPKPAKPPKSATPAYSTTTSIEPQVTHSRPPAPPPGPPPQPEHINGLSRTMLQASSPPPPPRPFPPSSSSPVIQTSRTSTFPLNKEKRDFVNPLRKSAVTAGNCDSRLLAPRDNVSASSASDTEGFRPDSVMTQMSSVTMQDQDDEEASSGLYPLFENAIKQNVLSKMNRDGKFEKQLFVLTPDELIYCHLPTIKTNSVAANAMASLTGTVTDAPAAAPVAPPPARKLPLNTLMALPLAEEDRPGKEEKRSRTFKILSKQKSFFVRAPTVEAKDEWMQAIVEAVSELQGSAAVPVRTVAESAPIYVSTESNCQICMKVFTFFVRKNHCQNCGKCICEMCSKDKMRVPKIDEKKLFRVCNPCGKELKSQRVYGVRSAPEDA